MPGRQLTQTEYALQRTVESFGNLLFQLQELYLPHTYGVVFLFLPTQDYLVPGAEIFKHQCVTFRGVFRGVVVRRGSLMFVYIQDEHWRRFDLAALERRSRW
jgi:hypothetical protein